MSERSEVKTEDDYDPRSEYAIVPAVLAILMTVVKCLILLIPYLASFMDNPPQFKIVSDETFNTVWIMVMTYWVGRQVAKAKGGKQ